jgi:hypothetical protein
MSEGEVIFGAVIGEDICWYVLRREADDRDFNAMKL